MKQFLIFISGFIVGAFLTIIVILFFSYYWSSSENDTQIQHIDVKGAKGNVILHTGMPKDSVLVLLGKPDGIDLHSVGNTIYENWDYKLKDVPDIRLDIIDGRLKGVRQN